MRKILFIISLLHSIVALPNEQLFISANELYASEKYQEAILLYDSIIQTEYISSELYYNLANCYYKTNNWAAAILNYERSLKLNHTTQAAENLALTKLKIIDKIEDLPQLFYKKWWQKTVNLFNTKTWQYLTLISIWLVLLIWIVGKRTPFNSKNYIKPLILSSLLLLTLSFASYSNYNLRQAIIFNDVVVAFSAPSSNSTELFSLHAGTKVIITDQIGEWINIKLSNGNTAWVLENSCTKF